MNVLTWLLSHLSPVCLHLGRRMPPRFDEQAGRHMETCLDCGQQVRSAFDPDTRQYYALRPKVEQGQPESADVATLLDRSRKR